MWIQSFTVRSIRPLSASGVRKMNSFPAIEIKEGEEERED
jgi:hypothetical protein